MSSIRLYKNRLKTINSKSDAKEILEEIVLKQGRISFKDVKSSNPNQYIFFEPTNLKLNEQHDVIGEIDISTLSEKEKEITTFTCDITTANPFNIIAISFPFKEAIDELYKVRKSYNYKNK